MSLATRLSMTFLAALALALAGFSVGLYLLARVYLYRQMDDRLEAALATLAATCEQEPDGLDWDPADHHLTLGQERGEEQVRWEVRSGEGRPVDQSANLGPDPLWASDPSLRDDGERTVRRSLCDGAPWQIRQRVLHSRQVPEHADHATEPPPQRRHYPSLVLVAGASLLPLERTLELLGITLAGLSAALWLVAALVGQRVSRRALAPLARMSTAAQEMGADDLGQRLPAPGTRDELDGLARTFNDLLGRLQEAFERQRRFTGDASHQLRTPLTAMLGHVDVALRRDRPPEEYRRVLDTVRGHAGQLRRILDALLFLARADAESKLAATEVLDLTAWLPNHVRQWSSHPRSGDLRLELGQTRPTPVQVQPVLLGQLLDNVVDNAFKYSKPGTPVTVTLRREQGTVVLGVEDRGSGISEVDLPHLFEPFYRSAEARRLGRGGVGLGLAMVRRIATAFGGSVTAENRPDGGSQFTVRLPFAAPKA